MQLAGCAAMLANDGVNAKYLDSHGMQELVQQCPGAKVKSHYVRYFDATSTNVHLIENAIALLQPEQIQPDLTS
jgi:hypothetical protein